jgi:hypothetical protein
MESEQGGGQESEDKDIRCSLHRSVMAEPGYGRVDQ